MQVRTFRLTVCETRQTVSMASAQQEQQPQRAVPLEDIDRRAAVRGAFLIMRAWGVGNEEARVLLGLPAKSTFFAWQRGEVKRVPADVLKRIGYLAGIYKALQILLGRRSGRYLGEAPEPCFRGAGTAAADGRRRCHRSGRSAQVSGRGAGALELMSVADASYPVASGLAHHSLALSAD